MFNIIAASDEYTLVTTDILVNSSYALSLPLPITLEFSIRRARRWKGCAHRDARGFIGCGFIGTPDRGGADEAACFAWTGTFEVTLEALGTLLVLDLQS